MPKFELGNLLESAGRQMQANLDERLIFHNGEVGSGREEIIRQFLRDYLPKRFDVSTGFVFDCHGAISDQLDIIIADSFVAPRFQTAGGIRLYPCESVVAVGQVRTSISSQEKFFDALDNLYSVKCLDRSGSGHAVDYQSKELLNPSINHLDQIFTFLLITNRALSGEAARGQFIEYLHRKPVETWTNIIFSLKKYLITFCCERGVCPNPMDALGVTLAPANTNKNLLLKFYMLLGRALEVTRTGSVPYWQYLNGDVPWRADMVYGATEETQGGIRPKYLHSLML